MTAAQDIYRTHTIPLAPGLRAFPVIHGALEYTRELRRLMLTAPPAAVALELPEILGPALRRALQRPEDIPVLTLPENERRPPLHFMLEPLEPVAEAARSALELELPLHLVDFLHESLLTWAPEEFPDTYALHALTPAELYRIYAGEGDQAAAQSQGDARLDEGDLRFRLSNGAAATVDELREIYMARELRLIMQLGAAGDTADDGNPEERPLLFVCGMRHVRGITRLLQLSPEAFASEGEKLRAFAEESGPYNDLFAPRSGNNANADDEPEPLEALLHKTDRIAAASAARDSVEIHALSRKSPETLSQPGYYNTAWLFARQGLAAVDRFHRIALQRQVYRESVDRYERDSGELVPPRREKLFFAFARNWSLIEGDLLPTSYRLIMAARAFGNDNFARIFYDILNFMQPLRDSPFPEKELRLDDLFRDSRMIRFRLKLKRDRRRGPPPKISEGLRRERYPGEWLESFRGGGICSYPPEDLIIENFGRYLQDKAAAMLKGTESKTHPFTASLMDGIDYRETIRNLHLGRIYVKDEALRAADAGSVVIIFDEDVEEYSWQVVWWGEHSQESDMAFYATPPLDRVVGPGICQSRYGGLMMTYPPGRLHDVWDDPYYREFPNPADRLLAAAIEFNERRAVVHLANRPPAAKLSSIAARFGQRIIHIPLSSMSPVKLARVRRFHVLDNRDRRDDAGDYIW